MNQYKRAEWGYEHGLYSGRIQALAQTRDGYLWIGTAEGLLRFDGIRFVPILTEQKQPLLHILGLLVDKDGILWVRAADTRIRQVKRDSISPPVAVGNRLLGIATMGASQTTGIYAADLHKSVLRLMQDRVEALPIHSQSLLISLSEAKNGRLWIGTDRGLLSWTAGSPNAEIIPGGNQKINCLLPADGGHMWVGTDDGLAYWDGHQLIRRSFGNQEMQHLQVLTMMEDRDSNLWVGTSRGLLKYNTLGTEWVSTEPSSEGTPVTALIQDREGDIWFGSGPILERLESTPIVPLRLNDSRSGRSFGPLYADRHGRIWFAEVNHGLYWIENGIQHPVLNEGLSKDEVYSIDGDGDDIWLGRRRGGITRLRFSHGKVESRTWTTLAGLSQNSVYVVRVASKGRVWVGTLTGGLNLFTGGRFTHWNEHDGLPANDISSIELGSQGEVWVGTSSGVCKIESRRCLPLRFEQQPNVARDVLFLLHDPSRGLWIGTSQGLLLANDKGQNPVPLGAGLQPRILGLGLDLAGRLWIVGDRTVMSAMPEELLASKNPAIRQYGSDDGLRSSEGVRRSRSVVTDSHGQLWIATTHELVMVDAKPTPLPVVIPHVEEVSADGKSLDRNNAEVSPGAKRLSFFFTGLDLHAPSRVRFRYRLDHFDKAWSDVVQDREATYTNLTPGKYTFRLISSNESNTWSADESTVQVTIEPDFWQRWSVRSILAAILLLIAVLAYHARTRILLAQVNALADERLRERTRIARDVHDTLLQGFISSLMHLHVAEKQLASDSPLKQRFVFVLEGMERVIEEARLAVVGLRTPDSGPGIESNLRDFFQEIADLGEARITLRITGRPRSLKTEACEEISSIAREAILNAMRHANAHNVKVTISWGWRRLSVSVSDDGCGIDAFTLEHGRAKHWGLVGMRERAKHLKGRLTIASRTNIGTRVNLTIPAAIVYRRPRESNNSADAA